MKTDIEIAQEATMKPITEIAASKGKVAEAYKSLTEEVMANAEKQLKRVAERGR